MKALLRELRVLRGERFRPGRWRGLEVGSPGVLFAEGFVEAEDVGEVGQVVFVLLDEDAGFDEREDELADVGRGADAPVLQDGAGHGTEALDGEVADALDQLPSADV